MLRNVVHSGLTKKENVINLEGISLLCILDYHHLCSQVLGLFVLSVTEEDVIWFKTLVFIYSHRMFLNVFHLWRKKQVKDIRGGRTGSVSYLS